MSLKLFQKAILFRILNQPFINNNKESKIFKLKLIKLVLSLGLIMKIIISKRAMYFKSLVKSSITQVYT